ncbi:HNH endonuclease [Phycicoccus sp. BSK3Z-2]|uniref:HNH endonuclease n=1 Tax=Phycicoccus avicenniae TaxID=2828860 RepID=A0A941DCP9_9MICO|nr:HNH endonuclease signature motif containing protein [Phycicoccus avicenniae]MBR7743922.1 HNH endonuclease [Phycicoccus avicenniae]
MGGATTALADRLREGCESVARGLSRADDRGGWAAVAADCQRLVDIAAAVQDRAVAEVARREVVETEDGTLSEVVHLPGVVTLDAADLLAPALGASHAQAQRRVDSAVRLAAQRRPHPAGRPGLPAGTGFAGLHAAMLDGRLDPRRADLVVEELAEAPGEVAEAVVAVLDPFLGRDDGPTLRRRCRRAIARISPDLLRERSRRARGECGLRRWAGEPGVDVWQGVFPSEQAARAWAAIDGLAHDHVAAGRCTTLEQARGQALTDLVVGNASVEVVVHVAVPDDGVGDAGDPRGAGADRADVLEADAEGADADGGDAERRDAKGWHPAPAARSASVDDARERLVQVHGLLPGEPALVDGRWLAERTPAEAPVVCDRTTGARVDVGATHATPAYRPSRALADLVRARDGRCRFPGCSVAARSCDLDHVRPWPGGPTSADNLLCLCRRHHRVKQRPGWSLRLLRGAVAVWRDPTGRERTTHPPDVLETVVLTTPADAPTWHPSAPVEPVGRFSVLESTVDVLSDRRPRPVVLDLRHGRCRHRRVSRRAAWSGANDPPPF